MAKLKLQLWDESIYSAVHEKYRRYKSHLSHQMTQLPAPQDLFFKRICGGAPVCLQGPNGIEPAASQFMVRSSLENKKLQIHFLPHYEKLNFNQLSSLSLLG